MHVRVNVRPVLPFVNGELCSMSVKLAKRTVQRSYTSFSLSRARIFLKVSFFFHRCSTSSIFSIADKRENFSLSPFQRNPWPINFIACTLRALISNSLIALLLIYLMAGVSPICRAIES